MTACCGAATLNASSCRRERVAVVVEGRKKSNVSSRVEEKASKDETEEINDPELL